MTINNPEIVIIDYNTGNVDSIIKATKLFNPSVKLTSSYKVIENAKKIMHFNKHVCLILKMQSSILMPSALWNSNKLKALSVKTS